MRIRRYKNRCAIDTKYRRKIDGSAISLTLAADLSRQRFRVQFT